MLVLWLVTLVDSFVHNCYFNWTGTFLGTAKADGGVGIAAPWITPIMSIGQVAEILTMFVLGATLKRLGWRTTMIVGILGLLLHLVITRQQQRIARLEQRLSELTDLTDPPR